MSAWSPLEKDERSHPHRARPAGRLPRAVLGRPQAGRSPRSRRVPGALSRDGAEDRPALRGDRGPAAAAERSERLRARRDSPGSPRTRRPTRGSGPTGSSGSSAAEARRWCISAEDTRLQREVALKVLTGWGPIAPGVVRFWREAEIASKLDHPGICTVYDTGTRTASRLSSRCATWTGETLRQRINAARGLGSTRRDHGLPRFRVRRDRLGARRRGARPPRAPPPNRDHGGGSIVEKAARALHAAHEAGSSIATSSPATSWSRPKASR